MHVVLFTGELVGEPKASGEISDYRWVSLEERENLAPVHDQINTALQAAGGESTG
jgi:8-oxo-dGTP pyrophosphatase MutT (NUDIX family)